MASSARLDELKKKFDENPRRYFAPLANEHRKSGDLDQAIALCRTHLPQQPGHISGHIVLAQALFESGSLDESREIFHTALGLDPENLIALRYLGDIAKESADVETARSWYQRVLEVDPRNDEIEQLIRDLDAPPAAPAEASETPALDPDARFAPSAPQPSTHASTSARPPAQNPRFAPLSIDEVDLDESLSTSAAEETAPNGEAQPPAHDTYDAHAAWSIGDAASETEIDPFDLDPSSGVDSLYDPNAAQPTDDDLLTEFSGANAPVDGTTSNATSTPDVWTPQPTIAASAEQTATEPTDSDTMGFEEGAFYLEPPPPEPAAPAMSEHAPSPDATAETSAESSEQVSMPGLEAFAAEYYVTPEEERREAARSTGSFDTVPESVPNADALGDLAEQATAEWQPSIEELAPPVTSSEAPPSDLGLEVMEFVPPSSESTQPVTYAPSPNADPILGRTLPASPTEQSATPAAFVTETMAELYLQQGFRNEALAVYRELLARNPEDASLRDRIDQIESGSISSIGMASVSENVVESALRRQQARPGRSVRSFFASLAGRRAPAPRRHADELSPDASSYGDAHESVAPADESSALEPTSAYELPPAPEAAAVSVSEERDDRKTPLMSAAETLASFDPFADASAVAEPASEPAPNATPAVEASTPAPAPTASRPTPMAMPAQTPPSALSTSEPTPARRSLEDLFPDVPATSRTEAAAQTLATAFGRPEPQGRPTRAASNELSLDNVFRGAPDGAPPADGGFSFDQFFSDSRASTSDVAAPAAAAPDVGRSSGATDAHDIEQFTAWLEGLKKK